jgi:hypothetical protein
MYPPSPDIAGNAPSQPKAEGRLYSKNEGRVA